MKYILFMLRPMSPMETLYGTRYGYTELGEAARRRENSLRCCALLAGAGSSGHCLEWPARLRARLQRLQQRLAHLGRLRVRLRVGDRDRDTDVGLW